MDGGGGGKTRALGATGPGVGNLEGTNQAKAPVWCGATASRSTRCCDRTASSSEIHGEVFETIHLRSRFDIRVQLSSRLARSI
jgi:hypothetical protein